MVYLSKLFLLFIYLNLFSEGGNNINYIIILNQDILTFKYKIQ